MRQALDASRTLFAQRGYAAVTMEDVAAEIGVTKPLLYAYFGNKERLFLACMEPAGQALLATVTAAVASANGPADALERGVHAFFDFVDRDRESWRVLFDASVPTGGEIPRRVGEHRERLLGMIVGSLATRQPAGDPGEVEAISAAVMGATEAMARWWLRTGAFPAEHAARLLIATLEPGLRALTIEAVA
jgi:AcrR family transcriptional regulator